MPVFFAELVAGLVMGLVLITDAIAVGLILMADLPAEAQSAGILIALLSTAITGGIVALGSKLPIAIVGPSVEAAAILSGASGAIHRELSQSGTASSSLPTVWALFGLSSVLTGITLWAIGQFRWGRFLQFIPYPVLGGFLAGVGWLVVQAGLSVVAGDMEGLLLVRQLMQPEIMLKLLPGLVLVAGLIAIERRFSHFLALPLCLLGAIALSHVVRLMLGVSLEEAIAQGWFLSPLQAMPAVQNADGSFFSQIDWLTLLKHSGSLIGIILLVPLVLMSAVDFLLGIGLGILAACVVFVVNYSRVQAERYRLSGTDHPSSVQRSPMIQQILRAEGKQIEILRLQGYLFFGTMTILLLQIRQRAEAATLVPLRFLVLDFRRV
ncbi:MAG: SulP family inorganic anion transporter, partial [Cyanobacteriota bacterium]